MRKMGVAISGVLHSVGLSIARVFHIVVLKDLDQLFQGILLYEPLVHFPAYGIGDHPVHGVTFFRVFCVQVDVKVLVQPIRRQYFVISI